MLDASLKMAIVVPFSNFTNEQSEGREVEVTVLLAFTFPAPETLLAATKHSVALTTLVAHEPSLWVAYSTSMVYTILSVHGHSNSPLYAASAGAPDAFGKRSGRKSDPL